MTTDVSSVIKHFPSAEGGFSTVTSGSVSSGAATVGLNATTGYANGEVVVFIIDPTDANKKQVFTGTMDTGGSQVTGVVWTSGVNQDHASGATIVDYATATHISMVSKGMLVEHGQDGKHTNITGTSANFTGSVSTDTIAEHTAATGVTIDGVKLKDNTIQTADALSPVYTNNPYKFSVYRSAAWDTGTGNQFNKVNFDTKTFDTGSNFDVATNHRFVAPIAGFYHFEASVATSTINIWLYVALYKNGVQTKDGQSVNNATGTITSVNTVSGLLQLAANDYVEVYLRANASTQSGIAAATSTFFDGFLGSAT